MTIATYTEVRIEPKVAGKGRTFCATFLASASADALWNAGATETGDIERPVFAVFAGSDAELRPFVANLMLGRRGLVSNGYRRKAKGFEFLKSAGFRYLWQREAEGSIVTVYLPELFLMDPGMVDPKEAKFVLLPSAKWAAQQAIDVAPIVKHARRLPVVKTANTPPTEEWLRERFEAPLSDDKLASLVPTAYLFAAFLDRRTRAPLLADGRFYMQLMLACLSAGLASWSVTDFSGYRDQPWGCHKELRFSEEGVEGAGMLPGIAFKAEHATLEALLAEEIALYFDLTKGGK